MLKSNFEKSLPNMTAEERLVYDQAVSEEMAAKAANIAAAKPIACRLQAEREPIIAMVARLAAARAKAGISLSQLEQRTGISKSSLSRLENSAAPNPTMLTLFRYAAAIGYQLDFQISPEN